MESEEQSWTAFLRQPTEASFRPVYEGTKRLVWTLCIRILKDPTEAGDAFQSAYCRLLELGRGPEPQAAPEGVSGLLCRLAIREADRLRKRRARRAAREAPIGESPPMKDHHLPADEVAARNEIRERVETIVDRLPEPYRLPLQLHYFHGLSQREVARALDQPLSTVSDRIRGGLRRLDPAFRRAGLREAAATLAGIAACAALLDPPLAAGVVFAQAEAASASTATGVVGVKSLVSTSAILGGIGLMKAKLAVLIALFVLALAGVLVYRRSLDPGPAPEETLALPSAAVKAGPARAPSGVEAPAGERTSPRREVEVAVLWGESAEPAPGARVAAGASRGDGAPSAQARTGDDGRAVLACPPDWTSAWLQVHHPEGVPEEFEVALPAREAVTVRLSRDAITGLVVDALTGAPLAGAVVRLGEREAAADGAGVYSIARPGAGVHTLRAQAEGHAGRTAQVSHPMPGVSVQDLKLDPAVAVLVSVIDEGGAPVPGARVTPSHLGNDGVYHGDEGADTDASGRARISGVSRLHPPSFMVSKAGYRNAYGKPRTDPESDGAELKITLKRILMEPRAIVGKVTDRGGRPIPDATVEWKDGEGTRFGAGEKYGQYRATTDRAGAYRLEYPDDYDRCLLGAAARGWAPEVLGDVRPGTPDEPAEVNITLEPGHWLRGRVVDEESRPLAGVRLLVMPRLHLLSEAVAYPAVLRQAQTDAEGRFQLEDLPGPMAALRLSGGDRPQQSEEVPVDQEVDLTFKGYGVIRGRVVDGASGEPIPVFNVKLLGNAVSTEQYLVGESFTSPEGRFLLKRLHRNGSYTLLVEAEGYARAELKEVPAEAEGNAEEREVALARGRAVEGAVVDAASGAPLAGAQIATTTRERAFEFLYEDWSRYRHLPDFEGPVVGADGAFRFLEVKPASILIRANGRRRLFIPPEARARYLGSDGKLRIPLERGERLSGVYHHEDGRPAAGVVIGIDRLEETEYRGPVEPASGGAFAWDDLAPGSYSLWVERKIAEPRPDFPVKILRRVEVKAGEPTAVELGRDLGPLTLRGRVAGLEGRVTLWSRVVLKPAFDPGQEFSLKTYRDWGWRFACPFLRPGQYAVEVAFYTPEGNRTVNLRSIDLAGDLELDLEVPRDQD